MIDRSNLHSLIACHECDALHSRHRLEDGEIAYCMRCGAKLYSRDKDYLQRTLALTLTGLLFYLIMISFPFIGISIRGIERNVSIVATVGDLYAHHMPFVALLVALVLLVFPLIRVLGLLLLLIPLNLNIPMPGLSHICRVVEYISQWSMSEIYLVGALVTFVKLVSMAHVLYGTAFWALIAFVIVMTAVSSMINFTTLWDSMDTRAAKT